MKGKQTCTTAREDDCQNEKSRLEGQREVSLGMCYFKQDKVVIRQKSASSEKEHDVNILEEHSSQRAQEVQRS